MQISKFPILLCALALCGGMTLRAEDNAAQAAARAALMQKMQQIEGNAATATGWAAPVQTPATRPAQEVSATTAPMTTETGDTPAQAAARAALEAKYQQLGSKAAATSECSAAVQSTSATASAPAVCLAAPMTNEMGDTPAQAAARVALEAKYRQLGAHSLSMHKFTKGYAPSGGMAERQIIAPPPPVSLSKAEKLSWLLSKYESDQLSPEQYQKMRADIIAGN